MITEIFSGTPGAELKPDATYPPTRVPRGIVRSPKKRRIVIPGLTPSRQS